MAQMAIPNVRRQDGPFCRWERFFRKRFSRLDLVTLPAKIPYRDKNAIVLP